MKVAVINGPTLYLYELCRALKECGIDVSMAIFKEEFQQELSQRKFPIDLLFHDKDDYVTLVRKFADYAKKNKFDVFHFHSTFAPRLDWLLLYFGRGVLSKTVHTCHNILPHECALFEGAALKNIYQRLPQIIVHAENNRQVLQSRYQVKPENLSVIPHGNFSFYRQFTQGLTRQAAKQALGLRVDEKIILFFGLIRKVKGLHYLLKAQKTIQEAMPGCKLLIAGAPVNVSLEECVKMIKREGVENSVILHGRTIGFKEVGTYFIAADVVALPYIRITQSGVALTAVTFGIPAVATDVGGLPEAIEAGKNGLIVPAKNSKELAKAIISLLRDEKRMLEMRDYSLQVSESRYNWKDIAMRTIEVYKRICRE